MSLSKKSPKRQAKIKRRKERWRTGQSNLQKAALFIKKKTGWSSESKGIASRAIGKFGENVEKRRTIKGRKELAWDRAKDTAKKQHKTFKQDQKIKDKGKKSYNKGKAKKDWVGSAYERRQKDADTAMREAARKRHEAWKKARAEKKKAKQVKKSMKATQKDLDKKVKRKNQISHSM